MLRALAAAERGSLTLTPQPEAGVTYAEKISKDETRIDWSKPASRCTTTSAACRRFPAPGSNSMACASRRCARPKATAPARPARCSTTSSPSPAVTGAVRLTQVQRAGKQPMSADEFLRGTPVKSGVRVA